jgi:hypothetical protein
MVIPVSSSHKKSFTSYLKTIHGETTVVALMIPEEDREKIVGKRVMNDVSSQEVGEIEPIRLKTEEWQKPTLEDAESVDLLTTVGQGTTLAKVVSKDDLKLIQLMDAACITNRHIEKVDNANIVMGLVGMAAKESKDISYVGTFSSNSSEDSLISKLGRPYEAAWNQLMILILVMFITLSIRFGLAPETRAKQRGARELVDGLAWMTRRKRNARWALRAVFDRVLSELERRHRVGREQIVQRPDLYLSSESAMILKDVEAATMNDISEQEAIHYAKLLKRLV